MANGGGNDELMFCHYYHLARYYSNSKVIAEYIPIVLLGMARRRRKAKTKHKSNVSHEVARGDTPIASVLGSTTAVKMTK